MKAWYSRLILLSCRRRDNVLEGMETIKANKIW